jgi:YidC/Oxa1 family membrane protein insertase
VLNFIYYPVSAILWFWWKAFGYLFGAASGLTWALAVVFLIFTLRAILFKPFVHQVRSMRKMQAFAPEIQKLKKKYGNDKQRMTQEMQKLQSEHGVNPLGGCLPVLIQVPVFIGLFHVLREFQPWKGENYVFGRDGVVAFNDASLFGAKLGAWVTLGQDKLAELGTSIPQMLVVMIPLMIAAGIFTHITARHSVARQTEAQAAQPQSAIMNKLMLYVFPIGVVVGAPFLPLAILIYWVANNLWTLGQQWLVYRQIAREEEEKAAEAAAERQARAPKPGQKPARTKPKAGSSAATASGGNGTTGADTADPADSNGQSNGAGGKPTAGAKPVAGSKPAPGAKPVAGRKAGAGTSASQARSGAAKTGQKNVAQQGGAQKAGQKRPAQQARPAGQPTSTAGSSAATGADPTAAQPSDGTAGTDGSGANRPRTGTPVRRGRKRR